MKEQPMSDENPIGQLIQIDEARIRDHLGEMIRGTVEETLNAMLDAEADQLYGANRYERSQARQDTRAGSYERALQTSAGEVSLKVSKLRRQTFETAIIERYRRRESSVVREGIGALTERWRRLGHDIGFGIGIAQDLPRWAQSASRGASTTPPSGRCPMSPLGFATRPSRVKYSSVRVC